jgi:hypothetical protein
MSASRRGSGNSIGPKILLAAVVVVAGVIGISGIYPQVIDSEWVPDTGTRLPVMSLSNPDARTRAFGSASAAAIPLPPRRIATTGQGTVSSPRPAPTPDQQPVRATADAVVPPVEATPLAVADVGDAQAKADPPAAETAPAPARAASPVKVAEKPRPVVKKRVAHVEHRRSFGGAYAQYGGWGGWGGWGGGWGGYR